MLRWLVLPCPLTWTLLPSSPDCHVILCVGASFLCTIAKTPACGAALCVKVYAYVQCSMLWGVLVSTSIYAIDSWYGSPPLFHTRVRMRSGCSPVAAGLLSGAFFLRACSNLCVAPACCRHNCSSLSCRPLYVVVPCPTVLMHAL